MKHLKTVAIIPARGGSNGLSRKNIRELAGKPLIAYSIEAALASSCFDRVIVSTEDEEIAGIALRHGAEVPFLRPRHLAGANVIAGQVLAYTLKTLYGTKARNVVYALLYPTHPFRPKGLLDHLTGKVLEGCRLALTVRPVTVFKDSYYRPGANCSSQDFHPVENGSETGGGAAPGVYYRPYGLASVERFDPNASRLPSYFHPVTEKSCLVDIDYHEDIILADNILKNNLFDFDKEHALYCGTHSFRHQ